MFKSDILKTSLFSSLYILVCISFYFIQTFKGDNLLKTSILLLILLIANFKIKQPIGNFEIKHFWISIISGIFAALLSISINQLLSGYTLGILAFSNIFGFKDVSIISIIITIILCIVSQIFINSRVYETLEEKVGTIITMILSSLIFTLMISNEKNFVGIFIASLIFSYITHLSGSAISAIIASIIFTKTHLLMYIFAEKYESVGILKYLPNIIIIMFFILGIIYFKKLKTFIQKAPIGFKITNVIATMIQLSPIFALWLFKILI